MDFEKYTERARGFVQASQSLALREGHQQFTPEHVLKVLLDDSEGLAAGLIDRAGGNSRQALTEVEGAPRRPVMATSPSSVCCWHWRSTRRAMREKFWLAPV
jgi:ATP-dependent Clp protease ATP-binding subunit ClpA